MTERRKSLSELEETVALMRRLGVTEWDGIKLGAAPPPPAKPPTKAEQRDRAAFREERRRDVMFAASSIKPSLPPVDEDD